MFKDFQNALLMADNEGPLSIPALQLTCVDFGGALLEQLYVTSARIGLSKCALGKEPQSGCVLFCVPAGWFSQSIDARARKDSRPDEQ